MKEQNQLEHKFTITTSDSRILGTIDSKNPEAVDIGRKIHDSLQGLPQRIAQDVLRDVQAKIDVGEASEAISLLIESNFFLSKLKDRKILDIIGSIDSVGLDKESRKSHLKLGLAFSSHLGELDQAVHYIEQLESEFSDSLTDWILDGFIVEKARYAKQQEKRNLAVILYKSLINKNNVNAVHLAVTYQDLASLSSTDEDKSYYRKLSADKYLETGNKKAAIANLLALSKIQAKSNPTIALETLETCIKLVSSDDLLERHGKASLLQNKANYLYRQGKKKEALDTIEEAFELDEGVFGAEISLHSSYSVASIYANELNINEKARLYKLNAIGIASGITDKLFILQTKVAEFYEANEQISKPLLDEVLNFGDSGLIGTVLLKESIKSSNSTSDTIELLDDALIHLEKRDDRGLIDLVHFHFGLVYHKQDLKNYAEESYLKSLDTNPFNYSAANNVVALYMEDENWVKAESFLKKRIELLGELPNLCYICGKALQKQHKYLEALEYLSKSTSETEELKYLKEVCIANIPKTVIATDFKPELFVQITSDDILAALKEFSEAISTKSRMHFWTFDKSKGKYKWSSRPEEIAKQLLIQYLSAKFGKDNIEILQEQRAGAGFIDLYLLFGRLKVVVELKMCGNGYTSSYAISGKDQIIHYQENTGSNLGYLVVFDSRTREYAKGFKDLQVIGNKTIYSIAVDVRNNVK
ncbi:tetratricopeptide repeat protein [Aliivibrio fischeri]|uniref:tetratricopeptide repeat protein n=1 Tax=Aliivibrio fischeri TaxID=668 RepID=UPI00354E88EB